MHPVFRELFLPAGTDLLAEEEHTRRAVNRARRARARRRPAVARQVASRNAKLTDRR
jgi:hypothetical protein